MVRQKIYKPITKKSRINAQCVKQIGVYFLHNVEMDFFFFKENTNFLENIYSGLKKT